ncbi:MAG: nucleoside deaminase [Raineya sp.]|jgi:tRNA(adenine34) deaminase|nr:nucleoside deaminase [Raineya sp.]
MSQKSLEIDYKWMNLAYSLALQAYEEDEIPVGAVIIAQNKVIAKAYNQTERLTDVTAHAEILAITAASEYLGSKYLTNCTLYVTLEPCVMCAGALAWSQISRIVFGAKDISRGFSRLEQNVLHPKTQIISGIMAEECEELLKRFFTKLRT